MQRNIMPFIFSRHRYDGSNLSAGDIYDAIREVYTASDTVPTAGGTLTINSQALSSLDYCVHSGSQVVSAYNSANWFTNTKDNRPALIVVKGSLTINAGQTFIPSVRKLFTVLYVKGDLVLNGSISMSARGSNHHGSGDSGGAVAPVAIRIATGTFSGVTNPQVPAAGGAGAAAPTTTSAGYAGSAGADGGTGGGGSGGLYVNAGVSSSGVGRAGTAFTGGTGGAGQDKRSVPEHPADSSHHAILYGGRGGNAFVPDSGGTYSMGGGAGNLGGNSGGTGSVGGTGTGGTIIIIVDGELSGNGSVVANGVAGGAGVQQGGAGSGGGSITILHGSYSGAITTTCAAGAGGAGARAGGAGGAGSARRLTL